MDISLKVWMFLLVLGAERGSPSIVGNDVIGRPQEMDTKQGQTVIDGDSVFTYDGFVTEWRVFVSDMTNLGLSYKTITITAGLNIMDCNTPDTCDAPVINQTLVRLASQYMLQELRIPLPNPIPVKAGYCIGYTTISDFGVIPFSEDTSHPDMCILATNPPRVSTADTNSAGRRYSIQAVFEVEVRDDSNDDYLMERYFKQNVMATDNALLQYTFTSKILCGAFCKRVKCASFTFTSPMSCLLSDDNSQQYALAHVVA